MASILYRAFLNHKFKLAAFLGVTLAALVVVVVLTPATYRSQAQLLMRMGRENMAADPTVTFGQTAPMVVPQSLDNEINSAVVILKSHLIAEMVVDKFGADVILGRMAYEDGSAPKTEAPSKVRPKVADERLQAVTVFMKSLDVEPLKKTHIIQVSYKGPSPELCQAVVTTVIDVHLDRHLALNRAPKGQQFLAEQTNLLHANLMRTEEELRNLKNQTGLSVPEGQRLILVTRIGRLRDEMQQAMAAKAAIEAEVQLLRDKAASLANTQSTSETEGMPTPGTDSMRGQLYAWQIKRLELMTRFPAGNPEIRALDQQIDAARAILAKEETALGLLRQLPVLASLKAKVDTLKTQLADEEDSLKNCNGKYVSITRLEREKELQEASYRKHKESLEMAKIDHALQAERISSISIAQPAIYDPKRVWTQQLITLALGLVVAIAGCCALALLLDRRDRMLQDVRVPEKKLALQPA